MTKPRASAMEVASERTPSETTALLVELGRAVKARSFYAEGEPEVRLLFSRAWRSFQADLRRHGPLEIEAAPAWLRVPSLTLRVPNVQLGGLAQRLSERGVRALRFETTLGSEDLAALVELLAADPEESLDASFAAALAARAAGGIVVNGAQAAAPARAEARPAPPPAPAPPQPPPGRELFDASVQDLRPDRAAADAAAAPPAAEPLASESGEGDWSLAAKGSGTEPAPAAPELPADEDGYEAPAAPPMLDLEALESSDATPRTTEDTDTEAVEAEQGLASAGAEETDGGDGRAGQLELLMRELSDSDDDFQYHDLARRIEQLAAAVGEEGHGELAYRALVVFARHAGDDGKRTPLQRDAAMDHLQRLASGDRLADLVDRACAADTESSLEATQVLLRLGGRVVSMLFRSAEREADPNRRGQIHGILIAMGEATLPELLRAFESGEPPAVRAAARLAGELQSPRAVPHLAQLLEGPEASLRQEAAKALVRIGDAQAQAVLVRALESEVGGVPNLAAFCLGAAGSARAGEALLGALRRAVGRRQYDFATELVRALGRLGRAEAARDLAALLRHRGLRYRSAWRELKLAAAAALGRIPGDESVAALAEAARARDPQLRRAAQTALERRAATLR
jgi:HEAT repeat protein